jgi:hypothetical protein
MKVRNSITPQGEKLTNVQLGNQWNNIDWKKAENHVNRLQIRITKAVKECKWFSKKVAIFVNTLVLCETVSNKKTHSKYG